MDKCEKEEQVAMSYNILNAIQDEVKLLKEMEKWAKTKDKYIAESIYYTTRCALEHIVKRVTEGVDIYLDHRGDKPTIRATAPVRKTDEMLERENIALQKAGENYRLIKELISDEQKENEE